MDHVEQPRTNITTIFTRMYTFSILFNLLLSYTHILQSCIGTNTILSQFYQIFILALCCLSEWRCNCDFATHRKFAAFCFNYFLVRKSSYDWTGVRYLLKVLSKIVLDISCLINALRILLHFFWIFINRAYIQSFGLLV